MPTNAYIDQLKEEQRGHSKTIQVCLLLLLLVGLPILSLPNDSEIKYVMLTPILIVAIWGAVAWYQFNKVSAKVRRQEWHISRKSNAELD